MVNSEFTKRLLRETCRIYGGADTFGFEPDEIGNHSLRSGAAMALFMMNHSPERIMILGRWNSDAFLAYIRPQVMEWTSNMARDMVSFQSFTDLLTYDDKRGHRRRRLAPEGQMVK